MRILIAILVLLLPMYIMTFVGIPISVSIPVVFITAASYLCLIGLLGIVEDVTGDPNIRLGWLLWPIKKPWNFLKRKSIWFVYKWRIWRAKKASYLNKYGVEFEE